MEASALRAGPLASPLLGPLRRVAPDDRLVEAVRAGRSDAFEAVFDRYHRQLLSFCRHMLGSREEAEDAVQQTFMAAYNDLTRSDKPIQLRPWLYTIARNQCLSLLRARREHASIEDIEPAVEGLAPAVARREDLRELLRDVSRLPVDQRSALLLAELGALSHDEIAGVVGCPKEKVKALVFQARSSLIAGRDARETPCAEIRRQLSTLSGGSLRRTRLRRHLRDCLGCREFDAKVKQQRKAMALVLPVVPTAALKTGVMSAGAGIAGGGGAAAATGGSLGVALANAGAAKLLVAGALAVAGVGGTAAAVTAVDWGSGSKAPEARGTHGQEAGDASTPGGVVPARARGEQAPPGSSAAVANGRNAKGEHGRSATSPGHTGTSPGLAGTTPGASGSAPGQAKPRRGQSGSGRGNSGNAPGHTRPRRGSSGNARPPRGNSGQAPGHTGAGRGNSDSVSHPAAPRRGTPAATPVGSDPALGGVNGRGDGSKLK
jgi:RNA polymerase sigma factor (sigma-70 family)